MNATDLKQIKIIIKDALKNMATKDDLKSFEKKLENFATKKDLKLGLDDLLADIVEVVDKNKAEKSAVEALAKRVDKIEQKLPIVHQ